MIKGGKYGFAKREATDQEKNLMQESFETIANVLVKNNEFKKNLDKIYDPLCETNWYAYRQWSFLRELATDFLFKKIKGDYKRIKKELNQSDAPFEGLKKNIYALHAGVGAFEKIFLPYISNPVDTNKKPK